MKTKLKRRKQRKQIKQWLEECSKIVSKESGIECNLTLKPEVAKEISEEIDEKSCR